MEHIDIGAFENLLLVGHDLFERFDSFSPPLQTSERNPVHAVASLDNLRDFRRAHRDLQRGEELLGVNTQRGTYRQVFLAQNAVPIDIDNAEVGENGAFFKDFVHVFAMTNL